MFASANTTLLAIPSKYVEYDCNGNITRLRRSGLTDNLHGGFGLVDNLFMTYVGNMLASVRDDASRYSYAGTTDFDGVTGQEYPLTYNGRGDGLRTGRAVLQRPGIDYILEHPTSTNGVSLVEYDFAPFQPKDQKAVNGVDTYQYSHHFDKIAHDGRIKGAHYNTSYDVSKGHNIFDFFSYINQLPERQYEMIDGQIVRKK